MSAPRTLMVMAGGTGGHIYPGLATADCLRAEGWHIIWLGTPKGMEARLVPSHGYAMAMVDFAGVRGKGLLRWATLPFSLLRALWQSGRAMRQHRPDVVLGMGGFVALPGGLMASLLNRPLVIHEQNSIAGLSNQILACLANRVLVAFPLAFGDGAGNKLPWLRRLMGMPQPEWAGNPVREAIAALPAPEQRYAGRSGPLQLLVIGGSLGASALNSVLPAALQQLPPALRPAIVHQTGEQEHAAVTNAYAAAGIAAEVRPFLDDMARRYAEADLVICRSGALTVAELAAAGVASLLVPYPHAVDDHQTGNARFLAEHGAALLWPQTAFEAEPLAQWLATLSREQLAVMAGAARALSKPTATQTVAAACVALAG